MKRTIYSLRPVFLLCLVIFTQGAWAGSQEFQGCYARWEDQKLTVGNTMFERVWIAAES